MAWFLRAAWPLVIGHTTTKEKVTLVGPTLGAEAPSVALGRAVCAASTPSFFVNRHAYLACYDVTILFPSEATYLLGPDDAFRIRAAAQGAGVKPVFELPSSWRPGLRFASDSGNDGEGSDGLRRLLIEEGPSNGSGAIAGAAAAHDAAGDSALPALAASVRVDFALPIANAADSGASSSTGASPPQSPPTIQLFRLVLALPERIDVEKVSLSLAPLAPAAPPYCGHAVAASAVSPPPATRGMDDQGRIVDHLILRLPLFYGRCETLAQSGGATSLTSALSAEAQALGAALLAASPPAAVGVPPARPTPFASHHPAVACRRCRAGFVRGGASVDGSVGQRAPLRCAVRPSAASLDFADLWVCHAAEDTAHVPTRLSYDAPRDMILLSEAALHVHADDAAAGALCVRVLTLGGRDVASAPSVKSSPEMDVEGGDVVEDADGGAHADHSTARVVLRCSRCRSVVGRLRPGPWWCSNGDSDESSSAERIPELPQRHESGACSLQSGIFNLPCARGGHTFVAIEELRHTLQHPEHADYCSSGSKGVTGAAAPRNADGDGSAIELFKDSVWVDFPAHRSDDGVARLASLSALVPSGTSQLSPFQHLTGQRHALQYQGLAIPAQPSARRVKNLFQTYSLVTRFTAMLRAYCTSRHIFRFHCLPAMSAADEVDNGGLTRSGGALSSNASARPVLHASRSALPSLHLLVRNWTASIDAMADDPWATEVVGDGTRVVCGNGKGGSSSSVFAASRDRSGRQYYTFRSHPALLVFCAVGVESELDEGHSPTDAATAPNEGGVEERATNGEARCVLPLESWRALVEHLVAANALLPPSMRTQTLAERQPPASQRYRVAYLPLPSFM